MLDQKLVRTLAAGESPVYEDLFPIGAVPADMCPIHNPSSGSFGSMSSSPASDSPVAASSPVATSGTFTTATSDIVLERVLGADGIMRMVMRQRR
jgi:hypothetical protein